MSLIRIILISYVYMSIVCNIVIIKSIGIICIVCVVVMHGLSDLSSVKSEVLCRICLTETEEAVVSPCYCKGTVGLVHISCLERWLSESGRDTCELCHYKFDTQCAVHYKVMSGVSIWMWKRRKVQGLNVRGLLTDIAIGVFITPITFGAIYFCVLAADFYSKDTQKELPPARFTTFMLLLMVGIIALGYFLWMYLAILYHIRSWYNWWQSQVTIKIVYPPKKKQDSAEVETGEAASMPLQDLNTPQPHSTRNQQTSSS